jgi:hypothetical protein
LELKSEAGAFGITSNEIERKLFALFLPNSNVHAYTHTYKTYNEERGEIGKAASVGARDGKSI